MSEKVPPSKQKDEKKIAFIISPIGKQNSEERIRSDQILNHIIRPIVTELGYEAKRADDITSPGIITTQIVDHIIKDPLVVADLTDHNPNVMYELALRHVIRKPVVQLICEPQNLPFDIAANRTIKLNYRDLDSVACAKENLRKFILEVINDPTLVDSPISQAILIDTLKQKVDDPVTTTILKISQGLSEVIARLSVMDSRMSIQSRQIVKIAALLDELNNPGNEPPEDYEPPEEEYEPPEEEPPEEEPPDCEPVDEEPPEIEPSDEEPPED